MSSKFTSVEEFRNHLVTKSAEDEDFRSRLLADPKPVVEKELGMSIPDGFSLNVHEENSTTAHLVIPPSPALTESDMQGVSGGFLWAGNHATNIN